MATQRAVGEAVESSGRLRFDSMLTLANQAGVGALNFAASVAVARALGPAGRGSVAVAIVFLTLLIQLGSLGVVTANQYFSARERLLTGSLVPAAMWLAGAIGAILVAIAFAFRAIAPSVVAGLTWTQVAVVGVVLPAALAALFLQSLLLGRGRTVAYNAVPLTLTALSVSALLIVVFAGRLHATVALALLLGQYPVAVVVYLRLLASEGSTHARPDLLLIRRLVRFGLRSYAATVLAFLVIRLDLMMVNSYLGARQAGLYSVAVVLTQTIYLLPLAVATNILPRVARGASAAATARVFRVVALIYGPMLVIAVPLADPLIHWIFGRRFDASVRMFYWLLPGTFSLGMLFILGSHFAGRGYPARATVIWVCGLVLNVVANVILLPRYGAYMASITASVTYTAVLILQVRLFKATSDGDVGLWPRPRELRVVLAGGQRRGRARSEP